MKKIISLLLVVCLFSFFLAGCGDDDVQTETSGPSNIPEDTHAVESTASWPSDMPDTVPEFSYGSITGSESGLGSWIVDFENVQPDSMDKYVADLKGKDWSASFMDINGLMTGKHAEGFTVSGNYDKEYKIFQLIVRKSEKTAGNDNAEVESGSETGDTGSDTESIAGPEWTKELCANAAKYDIPSDECIDLSLAAEIDCQDQIDAGTMTWDLASCRDLLALGKLIEAYPELEDKIKADMK